MPDETALTRNWHSPRSHSGTLSSRKRSGSPGGKKPRCESHFTRNVEPRYLQNPFLLQRVNHKTDLFFFVLFFFFFFFYYMVANHGHENRRRILPWFIPGEILLGSSLVYVQRVDFHDYSKFKEYWFANILIQFFSIILNLI